jgi:hypothetical protein
MSARMALPERSNDHGSGIKTSPLWKASGSGCPPWSSCSIQSHGSRPKHDCDQKADETVIENVHSVVRTISNMGR